MNYNCMLCSDCKKSNHPFLKCFIRYENNKINDEAYIRGPSYQYFPSYELLCEKCYQSRTFEMKFIQENLMQIQNQNQIKDQTIVELENKVQKLQMIIDSQLNLDRLNLNESEVSFLEVDKQLKTKYDLIQEFFTNQLQTLNLNFDSQILQIYQEDLNISCKTLIDNSLTTFLETQLSLLANNISKSQEDYRELEKSQQQFLINNQSLIESGCMDKEIFLKSFQDNQMMKDLDRKVKVYEMGLCQLENLKNPQSHQ
ncbi:hypothetical protein OXYTRIMIC_360 [Oxytricha trifallax]|uniref:Uncharacterized protein n=1 Tax=Oxytricha trifallax TaxID=1172189 RepID=A0A073HZX2_9SPIT|nr:hypothetical protein OXYTRIMIC_360 [Oxytricha trifallax]